MEREQHDVGGNPLRLRGLVLASSANGVVFSDFSPTFDLAALARAANNTAGVQESIQHIDDALHHVERTWPSFVGKAIPGEYKPELGSEQRPLRRMTGRSAARSV
jgi:hypothetical protein